MISRRTVFAAAALPAASFVFGGRALALDAGDRTFTASRVGALVKGSTKPADLEKIYGAANVRREKIAEPGGGEENPGAFLYKETDDAVQLTFSEDQSRITEVCILGKKWTGPQGLKIGMPLAQLQRIYGPAFKFHGFGWDYGGRILTAPKTLEGISVFMMVTKGIESPAARRVMGEAEFRANNPALKSLSVEVSLIYVTFGT